MKTEMGAAGGTAGARPGRPRSLTTGSVREHLPGLAVVCLAGGAVAGFFLALYWANRPAVSVAYVTYEVAFALPVPVAAAFADRADSWLAARFSEEPGSPAV